MTQQHLAYDLKRRSGSTGICGRVPTQVMRFEVDANQIASLLNNDPCSSVGYREDPGIGIDFGFPDIFLETVGDFLGQGGNLLFVKI